MALQRLDAMPEGADARCLLAMIAHTAQPDVPELLFTGLPAEVLDRLFQESEQDNDDDSSVSEDDVSEDGVSEDGVSEDGVMAHTALLAAGEAPLVAAPVQPSARSVPWRVLREPAQFQAARDHLQKLGLIEVSADPRTPSALFATSAQLRMHQRVRDCLLAPDPDSPLRETDRGGVGVLVAVFGAFLGMSETTAQWPQLRTVLPAAEELRLHRACYFDFRLATCHYKLGTLQRATELLEELLRAQEASGDTDELSKTVGFLGLLYDAQCRLQDAER
jgi:hypothetical protein